jgi:teichuronic acid exporter
LSESVNKVSSAAKKGIIWQSLELFFGKGFGYIVQIVLARLLVPEDFGLIGMAVFFTGFVNALTSLGLSAALIQLKDEEIKSEYYNSAFWLSLIFNLLAYLLVFFVLTPFAAGFYNEPKIIDIMPIMAISSLINTFSLIPTIKLTKKLAFNILTKVEIVAIFISGLTAIILASLGFGVYAIVVKGVVLALIKVPLINVFEGWMPAKPAIHKGVKKIMINGIYDTLSRVTVFLTKNIDYLIIGKLLSASALGIYTFAFLLTDTFRAQLMSIMNKVMFPIYGKVQNEKILLKNYFLKVVKFNVLTVGPLLVFICCFAETIVVFLAGNKWLEAALPIRFLSIAAIVHVFGGTYSSVLKGIGKFRLDFILMLFKTFVIMIPLVVIGAKFFGIVGVSVAILINKIFARVISHFIMHREIGVKNSEMLSLIKPFFYGLGVFLFLVYPIVNFVEIPVIILSTAFLALLLFYFVIYSTAKSFFSPIFIQLTSRKIRF